MINAPGYNIEKQIYGCSKTVVYRGVRQADKKSVIIKTLKTDYPSLKDIAQIKQEYQIAHSLNIVGVVKAEALVTYGNGIALILEDFGGTSLSEVMAGAFLKLPFLHLAIQLASALAQVHQSNIIHNDIKPSNLIINEETKVIKITDFGIATYLSKEVQQSVTSNQLSGTLAYISPEQTGRMNRDVDYRSDLYSLGVTFYEMLTVTLPYSGKDRIELIHCHIAKVPTPPHYINAEVPLVISELVMKLLAKTPEDRYQSAWTLKADLEKCQTYLVNKGKIEYFQLSKPNKGNIKRILEQLAKIEQVDTRYKLFVQELRQLAKGFKLKQIREYIKKYLSKD